jgi:Skp family chaperone for outer membrane proteins
MASLKGRIMRAWGLGAICLALVCAQSAAAEVAQIPEAHVLLIDRASLKPADPARDGARFDAAEKPIFHQLLAQHRANLILDKSVAPAHWSGLDVTREAEAALHAAIPEWSPPPQTTTTTAPAASATPVRMLFVDSAALDSTDAKFEQTLEQVAAGQGATLVVDRKAVVIGATGFDITALVRSSLETFHKTDALPLVVGGPDLPFARVAILDRAALVRSSAAGHDIGAQVRVLAMKVRSEFLNEAQSIRSEGARLKVQAPSLPPDERQKQLLDYYDRQSAYSKKIGARDLAINAAVYAAQKKIESAASPIVFAVLKDDQANFLVDGSAVIARDDALDITPAVLAKLDAALPHVDVVLEPVEKK